MDGQCGRLHYSSDFVFSVCGERCHCAIGFTKRHRKMTIRVVNKHRTKDDKEPCSLLQGPLTPLLFAGDLVFNFTEKLIKKIKKR